MIDSHVSAKLDRLPNTADQDEDELIAALENEGDDDVATLSAFRERRLEQLHAEVSRAKLLRETQHGTYQRMTDEKSVLELTTNTKLCVVHFCKDDFERCRVMDQKLAALAPKHFDTRFVAVDVLHAPFLVAKLDVRVLPCVFAFVRGIVKDRIVGFEGIGSKPDSFSLAELEARLLSSGVLVRAKMDREDEQSLVTRRIVASQEEQYDDDSD